MGPLPDPPRDCQGQRNENCDVPNTHSSPRPWSLYPSNVFDFDSWLCVFLVPLQPPPDVSCPIFDPLRPSDPLFLCLSTPSPARAACPLLPVPSLYALCPLNRESPYLVRGVGWTQAALRASASKLETARPSQVRSAGRDAFCTALPAAPAPSRDCGRAGPLVGT